jgi:hypothetical protein
MVGCIPCMMHCSMSCNTVCCQLSGYRLWATLTLLHMLSCSLLRLCHSSELKFCVTYRGGCELTVGVCMAPVLPPT